MVNKTKEYFAHHQIGQYFLEQGKVSKDILDVAIKIHKITGKRIGKILIELGAISHDDLIKFLSKYNPDALVEEKLIYSPIDPNILREYRTIILSETDTDLFIATMNPDIKPILEKATGKKVYIKPVDLSVFYENFRLLGSNELLGSNDPNKILDKMIKKAVIENGSDIHIEATRDVIIVRMRKDGVLHVTDVFPVHIGNMLIARIKGLAGMDIAEKKYPQDGAFKYSVSDAKTVDLRVSNMPSIAGENIVLRILDKDKVMLNLDDLGIKHIDVWKKAISSRNGIILVTGPTGAGKTTTLYATILELDRMGKNIITIEDPVEYQFSFVRQVQINKVLNLDFATFLKFSLRQDPDVILVGEIRDVETAKTAIRAAETGHLVFATVHSNDILSTFSRLKDLGISYVDMKYTLRCIMSQMLIRKVCKKCNGKGCEKCDWTGYKGRTVASEIALVTPSMVDAIADNTYKPDYETILDNAMEMVKQGITDQKEIERVFGYEWEIAKEV